MNLIYKTYCPVCNKELTHIYHSDSTCQDACYALYDYGNIQDITIKTIFGRVVFSIYHDTNEQETFIYNEMKKIIFKVNYLIPIDLKNISKFEDRISSLIVFS